MVSAALTVIRKELLYVITYHPAYPTDWPLAREHDASERFTRRARRDDGR